nr:NlpC/P60 family protein [uncultured Pedobacter sp.]
MKSLCLGLLFCISIFTLKAQSDTAIFRSAAVTIQKKYAPDKRSVYFNLELTGDSAKLESTSQEALKEFDKVRPNSPSIKFSSILLPAPSLHGMEYGVANLSVCNNRSYPKNAAEMMTQMLLGTPIKVFKKQGGFYLVQTPDGYISWTDVGAITPMNKTVFETWQKAKKIVFTADYGHSFSAPDENAQRVSDLVAGNILQVLGEEKKFYKVSYPDGRTAYLPKRQASLYQAWVTRPDPNAEKILTTAQSLLGVPYLWGGTSGKGVDCSGFTKMSFFLNGVIIPRDASQQALIGQPVDVLENDSISVDKCLRNLQPGDLLFFSAAKRRGINDGRVTHTAIYMGKGEFIQAAGMVRINSLVPSADNYDGRQSGALVGARRILTDIGKPEITRIDQHFWYK